MLPADNPAVKALYVAAKNLGLDSNDLLEESIVKLFKVAFVIIFIILSVVLIIDIGLLPKSPVPVPTSVTTAP